eukprot:TRINITY_DN79604_c0_g1_i1.p1 TRINITY_DN79604_c0_g1~~TRINITY_DN79604_c0_g1_i1.p1  ORF type:complete len:208 (-),score=50.22 TRINITY_DN79604_c0_g1_i1:61-684(-)
MKWQLLLLLLALTAVTFAMSSAELSNAQAEEYSLVEQAADMDADMDADLDADMEADEEADDEASEDAADAEEEGASFVEIPTISISRPTKGMDPFVAKHYKKGFYPGRFGRFDLGHIEAPKRQVKAKLVEDCLSCRFVWKGVEVDIGNSEFHKTIYDAFMNHCRQAMSTPIMYAPCQTMFHSLDDMITGYASGLSVDEVCVQANMCR